MYVSFGKKTPKIAHSLRDFITMPEEHRATAMGSVHKKFGKYCTCGLGDMLAVRQTHAQTCWLQYFATAPAGEVINNWLKSAKKVHYDVIWM